MTPTFKVKICGITNRADLEIVDQAGANYAGVLVEIPSSPRSRTIEQARELFDRPLLPMIAVTLDLDLERNLHIVRTLRPHAIQLHGKESPDTIRLLQGGTDCEIWKVFHLPTFESGEEANLEILLAIMDSYAEMGTDRFVLDASAVIQGEKHLGGTGKTVNWQAARWLREHAQRPVILAGGLNPENISQAAQAVEPFALDLSSGVEAEKGKKDPEKVHRLFENLKASV